MTEVSIKGRVGKFEYGIAGKARAQARVNILNTSDAGWFVAEVEGGYAVRHDGRPQLPAPVRMAVTIDRKPFKRVAIEVRSV